MSLEGEDLSKWQSTNTVDGAPDFVILKATQGTDYVDPDCDNKYQRAKSEGKLLGVYHFANMTDPIAEAEFFVNNIRGYIGEAILVLDFETNTDVNWAIAFLNHVRDLTGGVKPLIYMSASTIKQADWTPVVNGDYGLWVAGYPAKYNVLHPAQTDGSDMPYDILPWPFAAIWQYSSSAGTLDEDEANMSADAWHRYAAVPAAPAPAPEPIPAPVPDPTPAPVEPTPAPVPDPVVEPPVVVPDPGTVVTPTPTPEPTPVPVDNTSKVWYAVIISAIVAFLQKIWYYEIK